MTETEVRSANPFDDVAIGAGLVVGAANVIMQLSRPGVGYGVYESKVDSGNLFKHPVKRSRTTFTYLSVATLGTDEEKRQYRHKVNKAHAQVRSDKSSPVRYNAFDPDLQLWVAACLYKGFEDAFEALVGPMSWDLKSRVYGHSATLGTTLQVRPAIWPADREEFQRYWDDALARVSIDETIRPYLRDIATLRFLPRLVGRPFERFNLFVTTNFLPPRFREEMRLEWSERDQRRFDKLMSTIGTVVLHLSRPLRQFPYNYFMSDLRRRLRTGRRWCRSVASARDNDASDRQTLTRDRMEQVYVLGSGHHADRAFRFRRITPARTHYERPPTTGHCHRTVNISVGP